MTAPVGFDSYGYAYRDNTGDRVHEGRPLQYGRPYKTGDVIGCLISLPPRPRPPPASNREPEPLEAQPTSAERLITDVSELPREALNLFGHERKHPTIRIKDNIYFESPEYQSINIPPLLNALYLGTEITSPESMVRPENRPFATPVLLQPLPWNATLQSTQFPIAEGSFIEFYLNGVSQGVAYRDIPLAIPAAATLPADRRRPMQSHLPDPPIADDGSIGYYPAISMFRKGAAKVNFGPKFRNPPRQEDTLPMSERLMEREVEDALWDAVDEVVAALKFEETYGARSSLLATDAFTRRDSHVASQKVADGQIERSRGVAQRLPRGRDRG